jgi:hypothetical protein
MAKSDSLGRRRGWVVIASGLGASFVPTMLLTLLFAQAGFAISTFLAFWVEIVVGPVKYWLPILMGHPSRYRIHPMSGITICVYLACLLLIFAHLVKPRLITALMAIVGFFVWYGWALVAMGAVEY